VNVDHDQSSPLRYRPLRKEYLVEIKLDAAEVEDTSLSIDDLSYHILPSQSD